MEGEWANGVMHGKGCIKNYDKIKAEWTVSYDGDFKNGQKSGFGIERMEDAVYRGQFSMNCRTGAGRLE